MWNFVQEGFDKAEIALNGNRFLLGNGYMGYRGTMEEYSKEDQVSCMINGLYDQVEGSWREPVNAPNGLFTTLKCDGKELSLLSAPAADHKQDLDIKNGVHNRKTVFENGGNQITVESERFIGTDNIHLICTTYKVTASADCSLVINTGIDGDVWDINGPHLKDMAFSCIDDQLVCEATTQEQGSKVVVAEKIVTPQTLGDKTVDGLLATRTIKIDAKAGTTYEFTKYVSVYTSIDEDLNGKDIVAAACENSENSAETGYDTLMEQHCADWAGNWAKYNVAIEGDDEAQFAIRYSIYHLLILATRHSSKVSIPARGLSGQVYKGAVFWDTEMFMLPLFTLLDTDVARNLIQYRYHTLDGAREKAQEYGFEGAFFAWESQETGHDACSHFNVPDVFTGRPMRTYFRDKQIHVSAAISYAVGQYIDQTGDKSILLEGAAEIIFEVARFFNSYAYFKKGKNRFEMLDVTGPDEYHERVHNNAYTNKVVKRSMEIAFDVAELLRNDYPEFYKELDAKICFADELADWREMSEKLYIQQPQGDDELIEQYDGYFKLEDCSLKELKSRVLNPAEYLGGGNGLAASTQILKQADVVLMLNLFKNDYSAELIKKNWEYYEPRTEHGSSLSACAYAITAANIGKPDWAYNYFMKTASVDLSGKSKQFIGDLYIGGTHPAANGGAWLSLVFGFGGLSITDNGVILNPNLPGKWNSIGFRFELKGQSFNVKISKGSIEVESMASNNSEQSFINGDNTYSVAPGNTITINF